MLTNRKITTYVDNIKDMSDTPSSDGVTAAILKAKIDGRTDAEIKTSINGIVDDLTATADGSSGADNIGATPTKTATTVQGQLEELYTDKVDKVLGKGLSTNDFTDEAVQTLANKVDKVAGKELSANDFTNTYKSKLDGVAENANNYSLPTASATTLGGIKIGAGLEILGDGTVNGVSSPAPDSYAREQIAQEITNRANADTEINQSISELNTSLSSEITNRQNEDAKKLPLTGGTLTGDLAMASGSLLYKMMIGASYLFLTASSNSGTNSYVLRLKNSHDMTNALSLYDGYTGDSYILYGSHNITASTSAPGTLADGAQHQVYA